MRTVQIRLHATAIISMCHVLSHQCLLKLIFNYIVSFKTEQTLGFIGRKTTTAWARLYQPSASGCCFRCSIYNTVSNDLLCILQRPPVRMRTILTNQTCTTLPGDSCWPAPTECINPPSPETGYKTMELKRNA